MTALESPARPRGGPLSGLRVIEIASAAPAPFACMMLGDLGADIVRVDRVVESPRPIDPLTRGRRIVEADLKTPDGRSTVLELIAEADVLVEGFRPGVAERLGIGPDDALGVNPALIYGRMTGYGQDGPLASLGGHDINYISVSGVLDTIGEQGRGPVAPLNLVGDFGGGGMLLAVGILAALHERHASGLGQVIDASMVDGSSLLMASIRGLMGTPDWSAQRGSNLLDGGAPFYTVYETSDGLHMSVGAIEGKFYREFVRTIGLVETDLPNRFDRSRWPELRALFATRFRSRSRVAWEEAFDGVDACVTPVLSPAEAVEHPYAQHRRSYVTVAGTTQPAPAPRFSRTETEQPQPARAPERAEDVVAAWRAERGRSGERPETAPVPLEQPFVDQRS